MDDFAKNATAGVSSATPTSDLALLYEFVTNATMDLTKAGVSFVEAQELATLTTAKNVLCWKKTEMAVLRLSILEAQKRIYSMKGRNTVSREDNRGWLRLR